MRSAKNAGLASGPGRSDRRNAAHQSSLRDVPVAELMARPPVTVESACALSDALGRFATYGIRHLVVVDDLGRGAGMLSDRVVAARWVTHPTSFDQTSVAALLRGDEPFVPDTATLGAAARAMRHAGVDAVAVVDAQQRPVGVITSTDLIALIAKPRLP